MGIHVYVYGAHVYTRACAPTHAHTHAHARRAHTHAQTHTCTPHNDAHAPTLLHTRTHACAHTHTRAHEHPYVRTYTRACAHAVTTTPLYGGNNRHDGRRCPQRTPWPKSPEHDDFLTNFNKNWCVMTSRPPAGSTVHTKEKTVDTRRHNGSGRPTPSLPSIFRTTWRLRFPATRREIWVHIVSVEDRCGSV